jgi:hypothetical protein
MSKGNSNHKVRSYCFPAPLIIRSDSKITVNAGEATLSHDGEVLIRIADNQSIELIPIEMIDKDQIKTVQATLIEKPEEVKSQFTIPSDYVLFFKTQASRNSYNGGRATYEYYKKEKDASYLLVIRQGDTITYYYELGSLFDQKSKIAMALRTFTREKPFYRRDLKPHLMPPSLKQSQLIKACLEILAKEDFLSVQKVPVGDKELERYTRTAKMLP